MSVFDPENEVSQALTIIFYLTVLGLLWLLLSMTVVGIGPASTALYYAAVKSVRHSRGKPFSEFFSSLKQNWKTALVLNLILLVFYYVVYCYDWNYILVWIETGTVTDTLQTVLALLKVFLLLGISCYIYPLLSRYKVNIPRALMLSVFFCFRYLHITLISVFLLILAVTAVLAYPALCWLVPGPYIWLLSHPMEYVLRKYVPDADKNSDDPWYLEK